MSLSGTSISLVNTDKGAVSFGVFDLSSLLAFFSFRGRVEGDLEFLDLPVLKGESVRPLVDRPLRVRTPSSVFDRGVGGLWT